MNIEQVVMDEPNIPLYQVRNHTVVLDSDLAMVYGVSTKVFNQAVKRNRQRFPDEFMFQLSEMEWKSLRSQIVTFKEKGKGTHRKFLPWVFTEHGALMSASILNSELAVAMSVYVVRTFIKMRNYLMSNQVILRRLAELEKDLLEHDDALKEIYEKLLPLLKSPYVKSTRALGFAAEDD